MTFYIMVFLLNSRYWSFKKFCCIIVVNIFF